MGQPLSMDLRSRLLAAIDDGTSCRAAAVRFGVAPSTAIRWQRQRRETGKCSPKAQGGDMRSRRVEERQADILAIWEARDDTRALRHKAIPRVPCGRSPSHRARDAEDGVAQS